MLSPCFIQVSTETRSQVSKLHSFDSLSVCYFILDSVMSVSQLLNSQNSRQIVRLLEDWLACSLIPVILWSEALLKVEEVNPSKGSDNAFQKTLESPQPTWVHFSKLRQNLYSSLLPTSSIGRFNLIWWPDSIYGHLKKNTEFLLKVMAACV